MKEKRYAFDEMDYLVQINEEEEKHREMDKKTKLEAQKGS